MKNFSIGGFPDDVLFTFDKITDDFNNYAIRVFNYEVRYKKINLHTMVINYQNYIKHRYMRLELKSVLHNH